MVFVVRSCLLTVVLVLYFKLCVRTFFKLESREGKIFMGVHLGTGIFSG